MKEKCDVRDVCFSYYTIHGQDLYYPKWCHGKLWPECAKREAINADPEFIAEMRSIEDKNERQSALLHNEPKSLKVQSPVQTAIREEN